MAFIETPRFPDDISYGVVGGPEFNTDVVILKSGHEQRNENWEAARAMFDVSHGVRSQGQMETLVAFFRSVRGRAHGFRFKDWSDYKTYQASGDGWLGSSATGAALATYTMAKHYAAGTLDYLREITKPVSGTSTVYRNGSPVTVGSAAGNCNVYANSGTVAFVADSTKLISSISNASPGAVVSSGHGFSTNNKLLLHHITGMTEANSVVFTIGVVDPNIYTLGVNTNSYGVFTASNSAAASKFPQNSETLTWAGEYDVPCRFDTDKMRARVDFQNVLAWDSIMVVELRVGSAST
jgi:uncharacterized protein (TIGR02217 family)